MWSVVRSRRGFVVEVDIVDETPSTFISVFGDLFYTDVELEKRSIVGPYIDTTYITSPLGSNTLYIPAIHTRRVSLLC